MSHLTGAQHQMLQEYKQVLSVISEGFEYLENNLNIEAPPQAQQVFEDVLLAFQQICDSNDQLVEWFKEDAPSTLLLDDFHDIVKLLEKWSTLETNQEKRNLLVKEVIPVYESWHSQMRSFLDSYLAH
ncbi:hypothetical protein [Halobacillus naozhouensis]|uniref:DUF8042 domain-containing protein n=1 Tax=Halobacillus naozhouensis TaxID=554880 RepID=A0ABY8IUH2_9BACI|nr:hypothetical protein [Halobacillus naozhouensis]WFT73769.1 hypothetical protein P9989_15535 [Halobacillus naozhouensis]